MKKNDFVTAIFEEIKESLLAINKKLDSGQEEKEKPKVIIPKEMIKFLYQSIDSSVSKHFSRIYDSNHRQFINFIQDLKSLERKIDELTEIQRKRKLIFRKLVVWQSVFAFLLIMGLVLFVSNRQLRDNDLKFRYIKACGGINSKRLLELDTLFHVNRDELVIEKMRNRLEEIE